MPIGPGKYDVLATVAREGASAKAVVLIVLGGTRGSGFSVQAEPGVGLDPPELAKMLRGVADAIEASMQS
jgi:hypothetical protein